MDNETDVNTVFTGVSLFLFYGFSVRLHRSLSQRHVRVIECETTIIIYPAERTYIYPAVSSGFKREAIPIKNHVDAVVLVTVATG